MCYRMKKLVIISVYVMNVVMECSLLVIIMLLNVTTRLPKRVTLTHSTTWRYSMKRVRVGTKYSYTGFLFRADLGTRYFQNFKFKAKQLFLNSRQKRSTLQPKKYKLKQESLVSRKFKQEFQCQSSSSKQNENQAIQALSKKPKIFRVLILIFWLDVIQNLQ